jgi:hypothetical protein
MLKQEKDSLDDLYRQVGKIDVYLSIAAAAVILITVFCNRKNNFIQRQQERIRAAYDGLSPEEYN